MDKGKDKVPKEFQYLKYFVTAIIIIFFSLYLFNRSLLHFSYAYFWIMVVFGILPITGFLIKFPGLLRKFLKTAAYFFYLHVLFEFAGLETKSWEFPGTHYIGTIDFFGHVVPYEEIISWWLLLAIAVLTYYEFFGDDRK